jgi:hypothetical protein
MELPDDVLQLVREYAKPSEPYKMYTRILKILVHGMFLDMRDYLTRKLKKATRIHFGRFRHLFLELEKSEVELTASQIAFCDKDTPSEVRMEYYFKIRHFALKRRELIIQLKAL